MDYTVFTQLGIAVVLASLIGLEREHKHQMHHMDKGFAGLRTFTLHGLLGALAMVISKIMDNDWLFLIMTMGFLTLVITSYFVSAKLNGGMGVTSETASVLVYLNGVLCAMGQYMLATVITLGLFFILHFKTPLHAWAKRVKDEEFLSTAEFIIITFVILPLLPNKGFGPYGFFNPYVIWLIVVFISGISFVSYIAIKLLGAKKGIGLTGFLGGIASSTALSLSFSSESKKNPSIVKPYVFAMVIASSAVFFKALVEVAVLNSELVKPLMIPMLAMGCTGLISGLFLWVKRDDSETAKAMKKDVIKMKSPFSLRPALQFGVFFALILLVSRFAIDMLGERGLYLSTFFSSLLDADAVFVSVANMANGDLVHSTAVIAIVIAAIVNTIVKGVIFLIFGNRKVAVKMFLVYLLMFSAGGVSLFFVSV